LWREQAGTQLLEFALMLPMLLVLAVGAVDFGSGYVLKQKVTNAAREGARIAVDQSPADLTTPMPSTILAVGNAVVNYLDNAGIDVSGIGPPPTKTGVREWTYYLGGDAVIVIDRAFTYTEPSSGITIVATRVTVRYPFSWSFAQVIQLLVPSASYSSSFLISSDAVMKNLVP
jgi:Flp pilus assembly protein TadG